MKLLSQLFQGVALLLMALVVVLLPVTLGARSLGRVIYDRQAILSLANENLLNPELLATIGQEAVREALISPELDEEDGAAINRVMLAAFNNLTRDQWTLMMEMIAPQAELSGMAETVINAFYDWLESDAAVPELTLDLGPWKTRMSANALPLMEMVLDALPPCDTAGTRLYQAEQTDLEAAASLPACRPPEPIYSEMLNAGASVLPNSLAQTPDVIDFSSEVVSQPPAELIQLKSDLLDLRSLLRGAWLPVFLLFLIALPMGARSGRAALRWAGWPLLLVGLALLVGGMGLMVFSEAMLTGMFAAGPLAELPRAVIGSLRASGVSFISLIALPTLRQAIFWGGVGLVLLAIASVLKRRDLEKQLALATSGVAPAVAPPVPTSAVLPPPPLDPVSTATDDDDDSKPTGMFG